MTEAPTIVEAALDHEARHRAGQFLAAIVGAGIKKAVDLGSIGSSFEVSGRFEGFEVAAFVNPTIKQEKIDGGPS